MTKKKKSLPKVRSLLLFDGYAETSSWGAVLMHHSVGFSSLQEALSDLNRLAKLSIEESFKDKYRPSRAKKEVVSEFIRRMIQGDFQSAGDAWDAFAEHPSSQWQMSGGGHRNFDWRNRIELANAPSMVASAPYWLEKNAQKWPKSDPEVEYYDGDNSREWYLGVLMSYCHFANTAMELKMFLGGVTSRSG